MPAAASAEQRMAWVDAYARTRDAAAVCAAFHISRPTLRKWWARHAEAGPGGLENVSAAPRHSPGRKLFAPEINLVREWHEAGDGLAQIQRALAERGTAVSVPTIRRALSRLPTSAAAPTRVVPDRPGLFDTLVPDDIVFRDLAERITGGRLRPGDRLDEPGLAREHKAGRRSVRAALRSLASIGLVSIEAGRDAIVTAPPAQMIADAYAARRLVEIEIVRLLAARITPSEIAVLRQHVRRQADAERRGDKVSFVCLLTDFHLLLSLMSGNAFLHNFVRAMASITVLGVLVYDQDGAPSCAVDDHRALINCFEQQDADAAARQMAAHLGYNHARQRTGSGDKCTTSSCSTRTPVRPRLT